MAVETGAIAGSGPAGRLMLRDLPLPAIAIQAPPTPVVARAAAPLIPHNAHRRITARRLTEAKQRIPHFYLQTQMDAERLLQMRSEVNECATSGMEPKISINDCVVRAVALALAHLPEANVSWTDEGLQPNAGIDVAVAVATPAGLVTPVVRGADALSIREISLHTRLLAERARANALAPDQYQGGSCTISNLGMHGIDSLYAIVNPPQSFIVGVGRIADAAVVRDGTVRAGKVMQCTLSGDHRAIDGVTGARLLGLVRDLLERPSQLLL
jgi:pyruvate dehydrogenase E2 component (dihydrolipoamide acetyltransferase)